MAVWWITEALPLSATALLPATTLMMLPIGLSILSLVVERTKAAGSGRGGDATDDHDVGGRVAGGETIAEVVDDKSVRVFGIGLVLSIA